MVEVVIKDENGNEEDGDIPLWASVVIIILVSIVIFMIIPGQPLIATLLIFLFIILFLGGVLSEEKITFDKGIKSIIVERKTIDKKLKLEWKEDKRIRFSDIKEINVIENYESDTMGDYVRYYSIELIFDEEPAISLPSKNDSKAAKEFAIMLCKASGVTGQYIDEKKNSTPLVGAT